MAALMHPRFDLDEHEQREAYEDLERARQDESGRAPARPRLALVGEPRAADRRSPRTTRATYRRRRIVAVVLALGLVAAVGKVGASLGGSPLVAPGRPSTSSSVTTFVVQPGDSLWSIAERIDPDGDPRPIVDALARDRHGAALRPGETVEWRG